MKQNVAEASNELLKTGLAYSKRVGLLTVGFKEDAVMTDYKLVD